MSLWPSEGLLNGEDAEDIPSRDRDRDLLPSGEFDRENLFAMVLARKDEEGLEDRMGRLVEDVSGDSFPEDDLVFETYRDGADVRFGGC